MVVTVTPHLHELHQFLTRHHFRRTLTHPYPIAHDLNPAVKLWPIRLQLADEGTYYRRDGDVVLFRIPNNRVWQCRDRLLAGGWRRKTTGQRNRIDAARAACQCFDGARYRERLGLTSERHLFKTAAIETITELRAELAAARGRRIYRDYATAIERYLLPFFGERSLDAIRQQDVVEFERWRDQQLGRTPAASTKSLKMLRALPRSALTTWSSTASGGGVRLALR